MNYTVFNEEIHKEFLQAITEEQTKVTDHFINPAHPLVQQHAAALNLIKQRMVVVRLKRVFAKKQKGEEVTDEYNERFYLRTWSVQELETFEKAWDLQLPREYKVYLMEIGSGGGAGYFQMGEIGGVDCLKAEELEKLKKSFPITPDKIHDVGNYYGVKAWVYPDSERWKAAGIFQDDMQMLFGLPVNTDITDGCLLFACSKGQNDLYVIGNGVFEDEVWSDRLQYGVEVRGCFGAAINMGLTCKVHHLSLHI